MKRMITSKVMHHGTLRNMIASQSSKILVMTHRITDFRAEAQHHPLRHGAELPAD